MRRAFLSLLIAATLSAGCGQSDAESQQGEGTAGSDGVLVGGGGGGGTGGIAASGGSTIPPTGGVGTGGIVGTGGSTDPATGGVGTGGSTDPATGGVGTGATPGAGGSAVGGAGGGTLFTGGNQGDGGTPALGGAPNGGAAGNAAGGLTGSGGDAGGVGAGGTPANGGQAGSAGSGGDDAVRLVQNFNQFWKFRRDDVSGAEATAFDDSSWSNVGLPHSFDLPSFMETGFYVGYGWYRKHFDVPASWSGKSVFLEFQAAFDQAEIYVNGQQVGQHIGGYNGFSIDISSAITTGDNVVAVRLNNNWNPQIPPVTGDFVFQGGLYRDVNLVVTDPLHVTWYGTWVRTPTLAENSGSSSTVTIETEVQNSRSVTINATLRTDIVDDTGNVVTTISSEQQIAAGAMVTFDQTTPAIGNPSLWHPDHPRMYRAISYLSDDTGIVDSLTTPFGFRWMSWSATEGFFLNGSHYWLQGANVHMDHAGWGVGASDSARYRDVKMVKDAGMNFIRGSHYPKSPAFVDACDQLGVLLMSENCFWGGFGGADGWPYNGAYPSTTEDFEAFDANVLASLRDMIRIHRNHPSIILWSMGNEDFFTGGPGDRVIALLESSVELTHQLDPPPTGRLAAIGGAQLAIGNTEPGTLGDVAAYNGDGVGYDDPGFPNLVSEYGSTNVETRPGSYDPGWANLATTNNMPTQYPWRSGVAKWCMYDYSSHMGGQYMNTGLVDNFRIPKRSYYWYRNAYANVPPPDWPTSGTPAGLQLTSSTTTLTAVDGTQDAWLLVTVVDSSGNPISNNVPVTLEVTSGPGEFPTGPSITFTPPGSGTASKISILDGQAAIEFRTYYSGTSVITASSPGLASDTVTITSQGSPEFVEGQTPPADTRPYPGQ